MSEKTLLTQLLNNSTTSPTVSVIVNCLNCAEYLREAINSIFAQTYTDWEIIFWDNASIDNSAEIAQSYGETLRYFRSDKTYPLGKARNLAIERTRGKYIAFLDSDDVWFPEKLEKQLKLLEKNPQIGLVFSDCYIIDVMGNITGRSFDKGRPPQGQIFDALFIRNFIPLPTVVIRKEVLERIEAFNPRFQIAEEYDLFLRIAQSFELGFVDLPLAKYRIHEGGFSRNVDITVHETLEIVDYWLNQRPELRITLRKQLRKKITTNYCRLGYFHLCNNHRDKARQEFSKALSLNPFCAEAMILYLTSFTRTGLAKRLKKYRIVSHGFPSDKTKGFRGSGRLREMFRKR